MQLAYYVYITQIHCQSSRYPLMQDPPPDSLEHVLARVRDAVYKKGIRTTEFFCDYDKLRSGLVPESKASSTYYLLSLCMFMSMILTCYMYSRTSVM